MRFLGERVVEGLQHNTGYVPSWECTYLLTVIFLTIRDSPTGGVVGGGEIGGKVKCQEERYRAGEWEFPIERCHRTSGAGLEERRG